MTTAPVANVASLRTNLIASPWHTLLVLVAAALNAYRSAIYAAQARAGLGPGRSYFYPRAMAFECAFLGIVALGVWLHGQSLHSIFGQCWRNFGELFRDLGIGVALWFVALLAVSILSGIGGHGGAGGPAIMFLLPQTPREMVLWVVLSLLAGVCEEAVFRGYLQRQMTAISCSVPAGIVIAAAAFGAVHLYQGWSRALLIAISGILFGVVAHWRGTVRPGMFAHGLQDAIAPLLIKLIRH
jgi:membrane protease YdiL (CAAX protease family)